MKTDDRLQDEFLGFLTPRFAPYQVSAIEPRGKSGVNGNTLFLRAAVYSTDGTLPSYDSKLLKELNATAEGTKEGAIIKGRFKSAEFEIVLSPKRARQPQPV